MDAFSHWRWSALTLTFVLASPVARAEMITPNSISNPPSTVGSANSTPVFVSNFVTTQYAGLGLNFSSGAAITNMNGVSVWAPTEMLAEPDSRIAGAPPPNLPAAQLSYYGRWSGVSFVQPGTLKSAAATSLALEIIGQQNLAISVTYAGSKVPVAIPTSGRIASEANGGVLYTIPAGPGITSFSIYAPPPILPPGQAHPAALINPAWGVASVSFTTATAPEPSSLVLAGLGALGLAARRRWRRVPTVA